MSARRLKVYCLHRAEGDPPLLFAIAAGGRVVQRTAPVRQRPARRARPFGLAEALVKRCRRSSPARRRKGVRQPALGRRGILLFVCLQMAEVYRVMDDMPAAIDYIERALYVLEAQTPFPYRRQPCRP